MKNIEINLYPYQIKQEKEFIKLIRKLFPVVFLGVAIALALNIVLFVISGVYRLPYNSLNNKWEKLRPQVAGVTSLRDELTSLDKELTSYRDLLKHKVEAAHVLADIYSSLPKNIWLGKIDLKGETMEFIAYVVEWKEDYSVSVNKFIKQLQKEPYFSTIFSNIRLKSQRKQYFSGIEIVRFEVECNSSK
jgi:Tfp pilus assembly protein PilN